MTKRKPVRYAHPLDVHAEGTRYVPGQVGSLVNEATPEGQPRPKKPKKIPHPVHGYEPGGLRVGGQFYLGGEALTPEALQALDDAGVLDEVLPYLHTDREAALSDFVSKGAVPGKGREARSAGRNLTPGEQLPRPQRRVASGKPVSGNKSPRTPQEGLSNLPGGAERWGGLVSDEEAMYLSPDEAEKFVDLWNELPATDDYAAGARLGLAKRGWYEDAAKAIVGMFGNDAPRFTALLAATSPVKGVKENLRNALITWDLYAQKRAELGREMSPEEMRAWLDGDYKHEIRDGGGHSMETESPNIVRALLKGDPGTQGTLSGPKVDSFARNLLGRLHAVTNDVHMAAFGGVDQGRFKGVNRPDSFGKTREVYGGGYAAAAAKAREAAQQLNQRLDEGEDPWQPAHVQETTWSAHRSLGGMMGQGRYKQRQRVGGKVPPGERPGLEERARQVLDPEQSVYGLSNKDVHGNADFATLLEKALSKNDDPTGNALRRMFARHPEMLEAYLLGEKKNKKVQARRLADLPDQAVSNLLPGQLPAALRVGRRAAETSGGWDNAVTKLSKTRRGQRVSYMADRVPPGTLLGPRGTKTRVGRFLTRMAGHKNPDVAGLAQDVLENGSADSLILLRELLTEMGDAAGARTVSRLAHQVVSTDMPEVRDAGRQAFETFLNEGDHEDYALGMDDRDSAAIGTYLDRRSQRPATKLSKTRRGNRVSYMARPSYVPQPPANASYLPFASDQNPSEFYNAVMALGPEATQLLQRYLLADPNEDALLDLVDYLDSLDQAGNTQAGDLAAEVKVGLGNDMMQRVPNHRWGDYAVSNQKVNRHPKAKNPIAEQWLQPREAAVREARRRRLEQQYQQHPHPEAQQLGHEAFTDEAEDPASFDILGDWHEDQGETQQANLVRSLKPRVRKSKRAALRHRRVERYMANRFDAEGLWPEELEILQRLSGHPDPSVRQAAVEAAEGDVVALYQLHDALIDAGDQAGADGLIDLMSHAARWGGQELVGNESELRKLWSDTYSDTPARRRPADKAVVRRNMETRPKSPQWEEQDRAMRERPLPGPEKLSRRRRYSDALVASSNNTEENLSFDEAFARVQSGDQKVFKDIADQMTKSMGLQGTSYSAIGDWEDGAEHSLLTQIPGQADMDTLRYVGAWQGLTGNQRSVLVFRPDHGGHDSVYQIQVPETDAAKVRAQLAKHGIPFRTIIPGKQGTKVVIHDQKRQLRDNVTQFAGMYNAPVRESIGSGEYVGGSSRAEARAAYRQVIAEYEAKTGRRPQGAGPSPGPQAGGPVHPQQAGQPRGRRGTQGAAAPQGRGGRGA